MPFGLIGGLISGGLGLLGQSRAEKAQKRAVEASVQEVAPRNVTGPLGFSQVGADGGLTLGLSPELQTTFGQLGQGRNNFASSLTDANFIPDEVARLREISAPRENELRSSLRSRLFNRGRLGLGTQGAVSGANVNPELGALEEAFARADLARVGQARDNRQQDISNFLGLAGAQSQLASLPNQLGNLSVASRTPSQVASGHLGVGNQQARFNESFFGSLGSGIGQAVGGLGGAFAGGAPAGSASSVLDRLGFG